MVQAWGERVGARTPADGRGWYDADGGHGAPRGRILMATTIGRMLEDFLLPIAEHLRRQGWQVDALANGAEHSRRVVDAFDRVWDAPWSRNPLDPHNFLAATRSVRAVAEAGGYDVVHVHTPIAAFVTRLALRRLREQLGCRVVYTAHGFHFHPGRGRLANELFVELERLAGRWTDHLVVMNEYDEDAARRLRLVPDSRLTRMDGVGIDPERYDCAAVPTREADRVRGELGVGPGDHLYVMIAEFTPQKQQARVLEALERTHDGIALAFVGDGQTFEATREQARRRGLEGRRAHFLGRRDDVPTLLKAADATVLFSRREGLSRAVMESMCMGRPVIGSDVRGIADLIGGGAGVVVDPDSTEQLAKAMDELAEHPEDARRYAEQGRQRITASFLQDEIARRHERLYELVMSQECRERRRGWSWETSRG